MPKFFAVVALLLYLCIYYVALFVEPAMEKAWMQAEQPLNSLEITFINCSRFLSAYGIYITIVFIGILVYVCLARDDERSSRD